MNMGEIELSMKKIGIATFHYVDNYGAVLQSYALRKIINSFPGCCAEIVNYIPKNQIDKPCGYIEYDADMFRHKREKFWKFLYIKCGLQHEVLDEICGGEYDFYCIGSDQVWNPISDNREYMLPNVKNGDCCISYAPSLGVSLSKCRENMGFYGDYLKKFKAISVREENCLNFVEEVSGKKCYQVLDPTLLLKVEQYDEIIALNDLFEGEFVLFFWLEHDENLMRGVEFVNAIARKYNLQIIHSIVGARPHLFHNDAGCMMYEGIEEFLWYVRNAKIVVTNSYHATIFSLLFHTPFYIMVVEMMRGRIDTLNSMLGLEKRIIENYLPIEKVALEMDFEELDRRVNSRRKASMDYLKRALEI